MTTSNTENKSAHNDMVCPWCHHAPPLFGFPRNLSSGDPVLCCLCGRWSILPPFTDPDPKLIRADAAQRAEIRRMPEAAKLRAEWRQRHLRERGPKGATGYSGPTGTTRREGR